MLNEIDLYYWDETGYNKEFTSQYVHLSVLFIFTLKKYNLDKFKKIVIRLIKPNIQGLNGAEIKREEIKGLIDIVEVWKDFDFEKFQEQSQLTKKQIVWEILYQCILSISKHFNCPVEPIKVAFQEGISKNLQCVIDFKKDVYNKYLKKWGHAFIKCDEHKFGFYVSIKNEEKEEIEIRTIAEFLPTIGYVKIYYLNDIKWVKNSFVLILKNKERYFVDF